MARDGYRSYQLPQQPLARQDFAPGFDSATEIAFLEPSGYHPYSILEANGLSLAHIRATTVSSSILENTPPSEWGTLPWNNEFWSSLQVGEHLLLEAQRLGMRNYLEMFLSDGPASAGDQNAPAGWRDLSLSETAQKLENYTYQTATYYKKKGIKIALYGIGNEIGLGILSFLPGQRLPAPKGSSYEAVEFMETNV